MDAAPNNPLRSGVGLLHYRPWRGQLGGPWGGVKAIARVALGQLFRRKLFWFLYAFSILIFLFYFFGQYLQVFLQMQLSGETGPVRLGSSAGAITVRPDTLVQTLTKALKLNGSADTFVNFIWFEGYIAVIVLALAGSVLVGNDFHHGSMPFYLSKPIARHHYMLGKILAIAVFINLMTTIPALLLFIQYGMIDEWSYYWERIDLALGILGYGLMLTITLGLVLLATSVWLRRTVPLVMVWISVFVFGRIVAKLLVEGLKFSPYYRLIDLWNSLYLVGASCLQMDATTLRPQPQPPYWSAWLTMALVCAACLLYLRRRVKAVEVVS